MSERRLETLFLRYRDQHDPRALAEVFDTTAPALLAVARRLTRIRSDAEDLVQSTFVTAIERAAAYDADRPLVPWLIGILAGHAKNRNRRESLRDPKSRSPERIPTAPGPDALAILIDLEARAAVAHSVLDLPEPYRELLRSRLAGIDDPLSDASPGALRVRLHRAIQRLRTLLPKGLLALTPTALHQRRALDAMRDHLFAVSGSPVRPVASLLTLGDSIVKTKVLWLSAVALSIVAWFAFDSLESETGATTIEAEQAHVDDRAPEPASPTPVSPEADRALANPSVATGSEPQNANEPSPAVVLRGRVVDAANGAPIGNAECSLFVAAPPSVPTESSVVRTDGSGRFTLAVDEYLARPWIAIRSEHYAPFRGPLTVPTPGIAKRDGVDIGDLALSRGTRVTGRVLAADGTPVANAELALRDLPERHPVFYPIEAHAVGRSRADGSFVLENVPPGHGFSFSLFAYSEYGVGATRITIGTQTELTTPITLELEPIGKLEVSVLDPQRNPLPGAVVIALPICEPFVPTPWDRDIGASFEEVVAASGALTDPRIPAPFRVVTDASGRAEFHTLPADRRIVLRVAAAGCVPFLDHELLLKSDSPSARSIALTQERKVRLSGRVIDETGAPLADIVIERTEDATESQAGSRSETKSDSQGAFAFDGITGGATTTLRVRAEGRTTSPTRRTLPLDRDLTDVELIAATVHPLHGLIVDAEGNPVFDAEIACRPIDPQRAEDRRRAAPKVRSDADGRFEVKERTAGRWRVEAVLPGPAESWEDSTLIADVAPESREVRLVARHANARARAEVRIEVVDERTRESLDFEQIVVMRLDEDGLVRETRFADRVERGIAHFVDCESGNYRATVRAEGSCRASVDYSVAPADNVVNVTLLAPRAARVRGRIVPGALDAGTFEAGLRDSRVVGFDAKGLPTFEGEFRPGEVALVGRAEFEFTQVPVGTVTFRLLGTLRGSAVLETRSGIEHDLVIEAQPFGTLTTHGVVDFPDGTLAIRCFRQGSADEWRVLRYFGGVSNESTLDLTAGKWEYSLHFATGRAAMVPFVDLPRIGAGELEIVANGNVDLPVVPPVK